ncbi:MAG: hypothetical protein ACRCU3_09515 [Eubacteriaceae bacterium]
MSETMIAALIGAGSTLLVTVITQITTVFISKYKSNLEIKHKEYQSKRDNLNEVYKNLITIVNLYPNASPNDKLKYIEYAPNYSLEHFDSILKSLDYQIKDYQRQLDIPNITYERKSDIETQISNREYAKKNITQVRDKYYEARDKYKSFCELDKMIFDLYAGQDVRNRLVEFEVVIHNVFISGHSVGDVDDPLDNIVTISRRNLINSMRNDIGTSRNI